MNRILFLLFISIPIFSFGQVENKWQPDSIYLNRKVKKIFVYLNSPKDLSEIIEFDQTGKKVRSTKYSASYNRRTRKSKTIDKIHYYKYDSLNHLTKIVDSVGRDSSDFKYGKNNKLLFSRKNLGNYEYETHYQYEPFKTITKRKGDSTIVYHKTKEYDKDFYVNKFFGYVLNPKLKKKIVITEIDTLRYSYSDYEDLERFNETKEIRNQFNKQNQLIESEVKSVFLNDRINEYNLYYDYYKNGLLKSINGYVGRYFKYEYWE